MISLKQFPPKVSERPDWMNEESYRVLETSLLPGESPRDGYWRVAVAAAERLGRPERAGRFFQLIWNNWLCLATPVIANMGTERGLPISCFGIHPADTTDSIFLKAHEQAMMSKSGGGVGIYLGDIRHRGAYISTGAVSEGVCSWSMLYQTTMQTVSQGGVRRGAAVITLPVDHPDFEEFLTLREVEQNEKALENAKAALVQHYQNGIISLHQLMESCVELGRQNRKTYQLNHAVSIPDSFMLGLKSGDAKAIEKFERIIRTRVQTGEPYLTFIDNANKQRGECYERLDLKSTQSNLCQEIHLYTDKDHSFVCCLSSMNAARYEEWSQDKRAVRDSIWFLDAVMEEFIEKAQNLPGFVPAVNFARKSRALGLGVLGLHSLYQKNRVPVESFPARNLNRAVFKHINEEATAATQELAELYGEPEWCKGTGRRNTHLIALAPTLSNSIASGQWSPGIEPFPGNRFSKNTQQGYISCRNPQLREILQLSGNDTEQVWESIMEQRGSVQHLDFLSENDKLTFRTAREIPQHVLVQQAIERQQWVCQGQSLNLFFSKSDRLNYIARCHTMAWKGGLKSLYYCKSEASNQAELPSRRAAVEKFLSRTAVENTDAAEECEFCGG